MKLVKDLVDHRIVYYWTLDEHRISPLLASFVLAEEWFIKFHNDTYVGEERRRSHIDRRKLHNHRKKTEAIAIVPTNPAGRRLIDKPVKVDIDLAKEKMQKLIEIAKLLDDKDILDE